VGRTEDQWRDGVSRRRALIGLAGFLGGAPLLRAQQDARPLSEHRRALGINEMLNVWDFETVFGANVSQTIRDFTAHGDGSEWTGHRNRQAFEWVDLVPGKAVDPTSVNLATQVYDTKMPYPIMIAPTSGHGLIHPEGEVASHRGATAARTPFIVPSGPTVPLAKIAAADQGPLWWQLYGQPEVESGNRARLEEAQALGCQAIVITVDQQASSYARTLHDRNLGGAVRQARAGGAAASPPTSGPSLYRVGNGRLWCSWQWLDEVRKFIRVPVLVKGIMTAEDAQICAERGLGVYVSNHGGRSLDFEASTFENLPAIVDVVKGRVPVLIDSGFRRGTDILKALAMGANAVCVGRAQRWGLGAFGAPGVQRVLEMLQAELVQAAAANGHTSLASINKAAVRVRFP
jgi:4-hydroxymandelate oxidase